MTYQIVCVCRHNNDIVGYGVLMSGIIKCFTRQDVIDHIFKKRWHFYVMNPSGKQANVIIISGGRIIKTATDGVVSDNLSSLSNCNDCSCCQYIRVIK